MKNPVLIDTSCIVSLLDKSQAAHEVCAAIIETLPNPMITCEAVIAETCHLLRKTRGASQAVLANIIKGNFRVPWSVENDAERVGFLLKKYNDVPMDYADACLVTMAEIYETNAILTLDGDFCVYRINGRKHFDLLLF